MRSVPHRVVCLLGLDDGAFPRKAPRDGDDLMLDDPHVGDRDSRTEDRQLLLDALMAATDRLIITYTGNDERTNVARPPAVPVGELLDVVGPRRASSSTRCSRSTRATSRPAARRGKPWSFDRVTLEGRGRWPASAREPRAVPAGAAAAARARPARARRTSSASSSIRRARSCASGSGSASATTPTRSRDALPVELDALEQLGRRRAAAGRA